MKGWETCHCDLCGADVLNTSEARMKHVQCKHSPAEVMIQLAAELLSPVQVPAMPTGRRRRVRRNRR